ncbi:MAG: WD40 repeat domain-containing protein [Promethearchaeota archaeon]
MSKEFKINEYITLKLENNITNIYIKDELFTKCKFLLINAPNQKYLTTTNSYSIDDKFDYYSKDLEIRYSSEELGLSPEEEFQGHCSNLQAWAESGYSTWLLHSNLAFPLLKKLTEAGDPLAEKVFKKELRRRFLNGHQSVVSYLIEEGYFEFLNRKEFINLLEYIDFNLIDKEEFVESVIDYYKLKYGTKYAQQLLNEFTKDLVGDKYYFYLPLLNKLTLEGVEISNNLLISEIEYYINQGDPWSIEFLKKEGYLEYIDKNKHKDFLSSIFYPEELCILRGHIDRVNDIVFSPDSNYLISVGGPFDKSIRVWDVISGINTKILYGHFSDISAVDISPDMKYIASASWDKTIKIWNFESGKLEKELLGHQSWIRTITFSPDGIYLISGSGDNRREEYSLKIWSVISGKVIRSIEDFMNDINDIRISNDGKYIISVSSESRVGDFTGKIWDFATGDIAGTLEIHSKTLLSVDVSPDNKLIATGSENGEIKLWTLKQGELIKNIKGHKRHVFSVKFAPNGKHLLSCSSDGTIKIWDIKSGDLLLTLIGHSSDPFLSNWVNSIAIAPNGKYFASGAMDNSIKIYEVDFSKL